ncbi:hypothetical protein M2263_001511 [Providencia alcalifaciens]|nr:hypothetical protein [Providencia alcalifaciens]
MIIKYYFIKDSDESMKIIYVTFICIYNSKLIKIAHYLFIFVALILFN